jgi:hypothetical protein
MSNYPPGVTGNEPQITGEYPCGYCGGYGPSTEDDHCELCGGSGIHPEEAYELKEVKERIEKFLKENPEFGKWEFDMDESGNLLIWTNLRIYGEWVMEDD